MSTYKDAFDDGLKGRKPQSPAAALGVLLAATFLVPVLIVLLWNYGGTEVIQALGGPDGNVNIFEGVLAVWLYRALTGIARGR